ncbi:class I SAM-dependent methyltransferase [bacterium]|nr:class I SAM-dependent methyltransferase [bacterium]
MGSNIDVGKTFNKFASLYSEISNQYTIKRRYQIAASFSKGRLLDVGGASGLLLPFLKANIQPIVLDISYNMCLEVKRNHDIAIICADAEKIPFSSNSFDTVVSLEMIYYLNNPLNFIIEVERILKQNGLLVLSFYNSKLNFLVTLRGILRKLKLGNMFADDGDPSFTKLEELYQHLENTSLEVLSVNNVVFFPFKAFDGINRILEKTFLKRYALFNIVVIKKQYNTPTN